MSRTYHPFRRAAGILPAIAVCVALAGCSSTASDTSPSAAGPASSAHSGSESSGSPGSTAPTRPPRAGKAEPVSPASVSIPSVGVNSTVMRLGLNADGTVEVPPAEQGMTVGWYTGGAVPGKPGAAVLIGHNDTRFGRAVFHDLKKIRKGADISVRDKAGKTVHFKVTGMETVDKKAFPTDKVYGSTDGSTLRLITCDGAFDANGHPVDNLIVYAALR
ncbi:class F sortase [Streptomyces sp. NBC_01433]|uniref:class F sortase n=1 Tax=Streptomyces sp. NBC_01433 TaxID=2903864 RepID=UPI0022515830|nr:class F sortase [Streptomyces sp. NBC_01433]MCX4680156.1 class F sortase [Streptomyces sp. NBC_01433]